MTAGAAASTLTPLPAGKLATLVTFLQMAAAPPLRLVPARPDLALRLVERPRPDWYRDLYRRVGSDYDPAVEVWSLDRDGRSVGLLELDRRQDGEVELAYFGLVPELVGGGAGRLLMAHAIGRAFAQPTRRFWLHTCTLHPPAALGFYIRSGYTPYGRAIEIADDPRLTGALPRTAAPWLPVIG
jgi:GNAT superfamily N-acetyltransferase